MFRYLNQTGNQIQIIVKMYLVYVSMMIRERREAPMLDIKLICYDGMAFDVLLFFCFMVVDICGTAAESKRNFPKRNNKVYCILL